jgi:hypothetical protein
MAVVSVLGRPGGQVADELEGLFGGLHRAEDGLLNPEQRESQLILGEVEYFLAPLVLKLTPYLEQLAQLRIVRRDLTRELPPCLEVVTASRRVQEEVAGEGAELLARSIIELLTLSALLGDLDSAALGTHPDFAQPLVSLAPRLGFHPLARLAQVPPSLCQRRLSVGQLFPEPTLALTLGLEPHARIDVLSSARLGHRLDRLSQQLPCSSSPDMSSENKKQLRVPVKRLGELYERLGDGPLDLARLDPADLRSREAAPPRQPPHRQARTLARLSRHLGHRLCLVLHRDPSLAASVPSRKYTCLPPMRSEAVTQSNERRVCKLDRLDWLLILNRRPWGSETRFAFCRGA